MPAPFEMTGAVLEQIREADTPELLVRSLDLSLDEVWASLGFLDDMFEDGRECWVELSSHLLASEFEAELREGVDLARSCWARRGRINPIVLDYLVLSSQRGKQRRYGGEDLLARLLEGSRHRVIATRFAQSCLTDSTIRQRDYSIEAGRDGYRAALTMGAVGAAVLEDLHHRLSEPSIAVALPEVLLGDSDRAHYESGIEHLLELLVSPLLDHRLFPAVGTLLDARASVGYLVPHALTFFSDGRGDYIGLSYHAVLEVLLRMARSRDSESGGGALGQEIA
jgi:hypothetical protein